MEDIDKRFQGAIANKLGIPANGYKLFRDLEALSTKALLQVIDSLRSKSVITTEHDQYGAIDTIRTPYFTAELYHNSVEKSVSLEISIPGYGSFEREFKKE